MICHTILPKPHGQGDTSKLSLDDAIRRAAIQHENTEAAAVPDEHVFSERHNDRIRELFAAEEKKREKNRRRRSRIRWFSAACACFAVAICLTLSISAVREKLWRSMVTWFDNHMELNHEIPKDAPEILEKIRVPTYLPDGYTGADVCIESIGMYVVDYYKGDDVDAAADAGQIIGYHQMTLDGLTAVNNEHCTIEDCTIGGRPGIFITYDPDWGSVRSVYWDDGMYAYSLHVEDGAVTDAEILQIAESVADRDPQ